MARVVGVVIVAAAAARLRAAAAAGTRRCRWCSTPAFAEVIGFVGYVTGAQHGVAIPAVLASQFAAVAAFASFLFFGERIGPVPARGAVVIGTGVATVAVLRA